MEEFIIATHTQECSQPMVKAKLLLDKGQQNSKGTGLGSLVATQGIQTDDTFNPIFQPSLSSPTHSL